MLQQGAMALTSFHGKLSQPLKHARVPAVPSPGFPPSQCAFSLPGTSVSRSLCHSDPFSTCIHPG